VNIPCENCICLAICKLEAYDPKDGTHYILSLLDRCSILRNYSKRCEPTYEDLIGVLKTDFLFSPTYYKLRDFFGGK
jgi:hypothetical protein